MKFKRLFYDSEINLRNISKKSIFASFLIGITSAIVIYSWFYVISEVYRLISISYGYNPNILSESQRNYHNLFFAFLSLIFGNSIAISFLFSKPQKLIGKRNLKRVRLINDQIFLNFNFAYWFTKVGLTFGLFSMYMDFIFISYFNIFLWLLLIVLYLETWKTLFQILGKNRFKYLITHFLIFCLIGFLLSRIDVVNYTKLDAITLKNNPIIDLPFSDFSNEGYDLHNRTVSIKVKAYDGKISLFGEGEEKFELYQLTRYVLDKKKLFRPELQDRVCVKIYADSNIDIIRIKQIEAELYRINVPCVVYGVSDDDLLIQRFNNRGIENKISSSITKLKYRGGNFKEPPPTPSVSQYFSGQKFKDTLRVTIGKNIRVNDTVVPYENLVDKFEKYVNENTVFEYEYDSTIEFQQYINVLSAHSKAIDQLIKSHYPKGEDIFSAYSRVDLDELYEYRKKYPLNIIEKIN